MNILQINTTYNIGSTGRIVAGLERVIVESGHQSYVAYGYGASVDTNHYKIISQFDSYKHNVSSRLTDSQGLHSDSKTKKLIRYIESISPDIIHLHNLHGNYLNYRILFEFLKNFRGKIVWTLHDCWPFTGHCAYFDLVDCDKWINGCRNCPQHSAYPPAIIDNSKRNYSLKKSLYGALSDKLTIVPVSNWLEGLLRKSFLKHSQIITIHNGIDLTKFRPMPDVKNRNQYVLGVAFPWDRRKGLSDFIKLRSILSKDIEIILVGLSKKQIANLPEGIRGLEKTSSIQDLCSLYSGALALINPTYEDNFPTVNLEAMACGTPVITYRTGGSPESIIENTGKVVEKGNLIGLNEAINEVHENSDAFDYQSIIKYVHDTFDEKLCFSQYVKLYKSLYI